MPFRAKYNQPWGWDRKRKYKDALRKCYFVLHPETLQLLHDVRALYAAYYNRRFDTNKTLRHALQNANLNVRRSLISKRIDPDKIVADNRAVEEARREARGQKRPDLPFEGPAPDAGRIDIG